MRARAAYFVGANLPLEIRSAVVPELADEELLVQVDLAAVCGSDLHTYSGRRPERVPSAFGHEGIGTVIESRRETIRPGTAVTWSLVDSCGTCEMCTRFNLPQKCRNLFKYGHGGAGLDGTYSTHLRLRAGTAIFEVPPELDRRLAATANCALATAVEGMKDLPRTDSAIVLGAGLVGVFAAFLLHEEGWKVAIVDKIANRLQAVEKLGIQAVSDCKDLSGEFTPAGLLVEASGSAEFLHQMYCFLVPGGEIRLLGLTHPESEMGLTAQDIIRRCWTVRGIHNYRPESLEKAVNLAIRLQDKIDLDRDFHILKGLDQLRDALAKTASRKFLRVLIEPNAP